MPLRIAFIILTLLYPLVANANGLNCVIALRQMAEQGLDRNANCKRCGDSVIAALQDAPAKAVLMASWISTEPVIMKDLLEIQDEAKSHGIEILPELSTQASYKHSAWDRHGVATNMVFVGDRNKMAEFFQSLKSERLTLGSFEILNSLLDKTKTEFTSMHARSPRERQQMIEQALFEADHNLVVINDVESKIFLAMVDAPTLQHLLHRSKIKLSLPKTDIEGLLRGWADYTNQIKSGETALFLQDHHGHMAYLVNLNYLSDVQAQREINQYISERLALRLIPKAVTEAEPRAAVSVERSAGPIAIPITEEVQTILNQPVLDVPTAESVRKRAILFGPDGALRMGPERPFIRMTYYARPKFVAFYPGWLKTASNAEVYAAYLHAAGLKLEDGMPVRIADQIDAYRNSYPYYAPSGFQIYSLTDVTLATMGRVFKTDHPLILNPRRGDTSPEPISFVLFPIDMPNKSTADAEIGPQFLSVASTNFVSRRGVMFSQGGPYELSMSRPAVQLKRHFKRALVLIYPPWLKTAALDDVLATYIRFAGLDPKQGIPEKIQSFIMDYRQLSMSEIKGKYPTESLSRINSSSGSAILKENFGSPLLLESFTRSRDKSIEYILLPILESGPPL